MDTLTSRVVAPSPRDWLDNCAFKPRHHSVSRAPAAPVLTPEFESKLPPEIQSARERVIFPVLDRALESLTKAPPPPQIISTLPEVSSPSPPPIILPPRQITPTLPELSSHSPRDEVKNLPPIMKTRRLSDPMVAELHSFRQLSSPLFCPESSMDTLPEYILFGLIALLAVAWPILAMLGVMSRS